MAKSKLTFAKIETDASDAAGPGWDFAEAPVTASRPGLDLNPDTVRNDLARLVLGLVEIIRQLVERQALRRVEDGQLTDEQIESIGLTLMRLEERMQELKDYFGVPDDDLGLGLGLDLQSLCDDT